MRPSLRCFIPALLCGLLAALTPPAAPAPDQARLKSDLDYLAGPTCQGRGTGQPGQVLAAAYIARRMQENGLEPLKGEGMGGPTPYHFMYELERWRLEPARSSLRLGGRQLSLDRDFVTMQLSPREGELVFAQDPKSPELKGKWALLTITEDEDSETAAKRYQQAMDAGALGVVEVAAKPGHPSPAFRRATTYMQERGHEGRYTLKGKEPIQKPLVLLTERGQKALGLDAKALDPKSLAGGARSLGRLGLDPGVARDRVQASDLAGLIPGSDPRLKDEFVIISAHHDHLGLEGKTLYPGADDNGSGTVGILEVGRLLKDAHPRRSVIVLSVSAEELGLFGSEAFLEHPPLDLKQVKADINLDMIGREAIDDLTVTPAMVDGAVSSLTQRGREFAAELGIKLRPDADPYWKRSDHYNFFQKGIPTVFFFDLMTQDYHQPSDTPDKIDFAKLARVAQLAERLALDTADADAPPQLLPKSTWALWTWPEALAPPAAAK